MCQKLDFRWVQDLIAAKFPDPEPYELCVRAHRAVAGVLFSAAVLNAVSVPQLAKFTGLHPAFIAAIGWNMQTNHLWTLAGYDSSEWLSPAGELDESAFLEHVDVAWGDTWCDAAARSGGAIDVYETYTRLEGVRR